MSRIEKYRELEKLNGGGFSEYFIGALASYVTDYIWQMALDVAVECCEKYDKKGVKDE